MSAPFLELPRLVAGAAKVDEKTVFYRTTGRVRPDEIADYYMGLLQKGTTIIVLRNGCSYLVEMGIEEFDRVVEDYYSFIGNHSDFKAGIYNEASKRAYFKYKEISRDMRR